MRGDAYINENALQKKRFWTVKKPLRWFFRRFLAPACGPDFAAALRCVTRVSVFLPRTCHDKNILQKKSVITQTFLWRRKRDLNPRDAFTPYSLSRGAPSPLGYFSVCIKLKVSQTAKSKWRREWDSNPRMLAHRRFSRPVP